MSSTRAADTIIQTFAAVISTRFPFPGNSSFPRTADAGATPLIDAHAHWYPREFVELMEKEGPANGAKMGKDNAGNPVVVSGNHGRRVAESVYPRGRIYAYVMPTG